jgi:ribosomal protein S4E
MFDDGHAKNSVLFLLTLDTVNNNKKIVKKFIKNGYHIAINMCDSKNIRKKDEASLYLADKLFISKGNKTIEDDLNKYPSELTDRVIYTDVLEKIGK